MDSEAELDLVTVDPLSWKLNNDTTDCVKRVYLCNHSKKRITFQTRSGNSKLFFVYPKIGVVNAEEGRYLGIKVLRRKAAFRNLRTTSINVSVAFWPDNYTGNPAQLWQPTNALLSCQKQFSVQFKIVRVQDIDNEDDDMGDEEKLQEEAEARNYTYSERGGRDLLNRNTKGDHHY